MNQLRMFMMVAVILLLGQASGCSSENVVSETKNVFGTDDRVTPPDVIPYRAVGRLDSGCTGTLIDQRLVLTAAHCIVDAQTGSVKQNLGWFRPNLRNNDLQAPSAWVVRAWVGAENPDGNRLRDFAVMELDEPLGQTYGYLPVRDFDIASHIPFRTDLIGYSADREQGGTPSLHRGCSVQEIVQDRLFHDCDGTAGVSGGPMLNSIGANTYISAMTVSEYRQGSPTSVHRDTYEKEYANVAIPAKNFIELVNALRSTVAVGRPEPTLPDITLKINPMERPGGDPHQPAHSILDVADEATIARNATVLDQTFQLLLSQINDFNHWGNARDVRLGRLGRQLEVQTKKYQGTVNDTVHGLFHGSHQYAVFSAWSATDDLVAELLAFPNATNQPSLAVPMQQQLQPALDSLERLDQLLFR